MKTINDWTKKDFYALPVIGWRDEVEPFDSLVVIPTRSIHDSGFRVMDFVAVRGDKPVFMISGGSDIIHIDGIGGLGKDWVNKYGGVPKTIPPIGWSVDCLKKSGLLRIFCGKKLTCGPALSSFEVYAINEP